MELKEYVWNIIKDGIKKDIVWNENDIETMEWNYRLDHFDVMKIIDELIQEGKLERIWVADDCEDLPVKKLRYILRFPSEFNHELLSENEIEKMLKSN